MRRSDLQTLAEARLADAKALMRARRWAGAYYLAGYAVEAGLKSCVLAHIESSGRLFTDNAFLKSLSECWTHDIIKLIRIADLQSTLDAKLKAGGAFTGYWLVAKDWKETSRYERKNKIDAEALYEAISHDPDGVLKWIRTHW